MRTWEKPPANGYQTKLPLVIWIHGGAFLVGSKDDTVPLDLLSPHGDADKTVPFNQSELLEAALKNANMPVTFHAVKGGGHGGFRDDRIGPMVTRFLAEHLTGSPRR